jgi:hypothetical protein
MDEARAMELVDRIASDSQMLERFAQDPVALFESSGITLTSEDREALLAAKALKGEELTSRISKCR